MHTVRDCDSEKNAALTLDELERWLVHETTGVYHGEVHRALGNTPLAARIDAGYSPSRS
jgi:hypothetical protein